ncbi:MAG: N-acetylglucosamine-6-phosphate deacetylase [Nocardioidaceae bacterium]
MTGPPPQDHLVTAGRVLTPDLMLRPGWVETHGGRIVSVGRGAAPRRPDAEHPDEVLVPGFVDTHVHGGGGGSFSTTDAAEARAAAATHLRLGTTSLVASLVTAPMAELGEQVAVLADLVGHGTLAGIHLEGPWLSPELNGAHDPSGLSTPTADAVRALLDEGRGTVRMVTLAPELDHGLDAVRLLVGQGVVVAVGHTAADHATTRAAVDAGATVATHLFNAMAPLHHRRPGPVLALLEDPRVSVELVVDGVHLHPSVAAFAARAAAGGFHLVTDAMAAAGAPEGLYRLGRRAVLVQHGVATLAGAATIAGSTLTMHAALLNAVQAGIPLLDAVRAATATPADRLGLRDVGTLAPGRAADLVVLTDRLDVVRVMHRGTWL